MRLILAEPILNNGDTPCAGDGCPRSATYSFVVVGAPASEPPIRTCRDCGGILATYPGFIGKLKTGRSGYCIINAHNACATVAVPGCGCKCHGRVPQFPEPGEVTE